MDTDMQTDCLSQYFHVAGGMCDARSPPVCCCTLGSTSKKTLKPHQYTLYSTCPLHPPGCRRFICTTYCVLRVQHSQGLHTAFGPYEPLPPMEVHTQCTCTRVMMHMLCVLGRVVAVRTPRTRAEVRPWSCNRDPSWASHAFAQPEAPGRRHLLTSDDAQVDVYEMRELTLDSWRDLRLFLSPLEAVWNAALLDFIDALPAQAVVVRNEVRLLCAPMSVLPRRAEDGATPLHMAVAVPHNIGCVRLVSARLPPAAFQCTDAGGCTPLHLVVEAGHADVAVHLLHRGAAWAGLTPAQQQRAMPWACQFGDEGLVRVACAALGPGAGAVREGPRRAALQKGLYAASAERGRAVVELLLAAGAEAAQGDAENEGCTALIYAAQAKNLEVVQLLLEARAEVDAEDGEGQTALMHAVQARHVPGWQALLEAGADVNRGDLAGRTALMYAALEGHAAAIHALVRAGADVQAQMKGGWTALMYAAQNSNVPAIEVCRLSSPETCPMH